MKKILLASLFFLSSCGLDNIINIPAKVYTDKPLIFELEWLNKDNLIFSASMKKANKIDLYKLDIKTKEINTIIDDFRNNNFTLTKDSKKIIYTYGGKYGSTKDNPKKYTEIHIRNIEENIEKIITTDIEESLSKVNYIPNTNKLIFSTGNNICTIDEDGKNFEKIISDEKNNDEKKLYNFESISEDGKKIIYKTYKFHDDSTIKVNLADISDSKNIKNETILSGSEFISYNFEKNDDVVILKKDNFFSPVFFYSSIKYNLKDKKLEKFNNNSFYESFKINDNNDKVAFISRKKETQEIYLSNLDGTEEEMLTNNFKTNFYTYLGKEIDVK
ncbi:MAG: hypothetical protein AABZ74_15110 [Cyanobacteriota bacterium]